MEDAVTVTIELNEELEEVLERYQWEFENYCDFKVNLLTDETIKDCYGDKFQNICLQVKDARDEENTISLNVLLDENYNCFYDIYDYQLEELDSPSDLWKFFYFESGRCNK